MGEIGDLNFGSFLLVMSGYWGKKTTVNYSNWGYENDLDFWSYDI